MEHWSGRLAVVTGAASGIGASITQHLTNYGVKVVGLDKAGMPEGVEGLKCDVGDQKEVEEAFKEIDKKFGPISIMVNNAGILRDVNFQGSKGSPDDWQEMLNTNVLGLSLCTRYALQSMRKHNIDDGQFIHINSWASHTMPNSSEMSMYYASKHAVTVLAEGLRKELLTLKSKIRVSSICPGYVQTGLFKSMGTKSEAFKALPGLKPENISQALIYILSTPIDVNVYELTIKPVGESV